MDVIDMLAAIPLPWWLFGAAALLLLVGLVCLVIGWRREGRVVAAQGQQALDGRELGTRYQHALANIEPFGSRVEFVGVVEALSPLRSPMSETSCVAYRHSRSEEYERELRGSHGSQPRSSSEIEYEASNDHTHAVASFVLRDAYSAVTVQTARAHFDLKPMGVRYETYSSFNTEREVMQEEWVLAVGEPAYVLGYLVRGDGPTIAAHPLERDKPFVISYRSEKAFEASQAASSGWLYLFAFVLIGFAVAVALAALWLLRMAV